MKQFSQVFPLAIIVISLIFAFSVAPYLPDLMATHWGVNGQVNGYSSKTFGLYFMPFLSLIIYIVFRILPKTDPYRKNFLEFESYFNIFIIIIFTFFFYLYLLTIFWNLGYRFNLITFLAPAMAILYYYAGVLTSKTKRNWFVGIRTPWTLTNDQVWYKTHQLGSKLFKTSALLSLLAIILPQFAIFFILIPVILSTFSVFVYSYWQYRIINCK